MPQDSVTLYTTKERSSSLSLQAIDAETTAKIQKIIDRLFVFARAEEPFTFVLDDPSGTSGAEIKDEDHVGRDKGMKVRWQCRLKLDN